MIWKILFFTWFHAHVAPSRVSWREATIGFCMVVFLSVIRWRMEKAWLARLSPDMPKAFLRICVTLTLVGLLGWLSNGVTGAVNAERMPVDAAYIGGDAANMALHTTMSADTKFRYLADIIVVRLSDLLRYFFPGDDHVSIGDLMIASSIIFSWWLVLAMVFWAICASFKKYVSR